tara:strand:+ start:22493 stop:23017 length:525 start_codon:yes stop_codon:yes gene_type:complete
MNLISKTFALAIFSLSVNSFANTQGGYCVGSDYLMPDFQLTYTYKVACSWTEKNISKTKMVPFYASEKVKAAIKTAVGNEVAKLGVQPIANLDGYIIYSNVPKAEGEKFCLVKPSLGGFGKLACDAGVNLATNALQKESDVQILLNNGFTKVIDIQRVADWSGSLVTASLYSKK